MRTHTFRFYVEVELAHEGGKPAPSAKLGELVHEVVADVVGEGEEYCFDDRDTYAASTRYSIAASRVQCLDVEQAKRLVGPARFRRPVEELLEETPVAPEPKRNGKGWQALTLDAFTFGDVVEVAIEDRRLGYNAKFRPCIYVAEDRARGWHAVAQLSSKPVLQNGFTTRSPVEWKGDIYTADSYIRGTELTWVPREAIKRVVGRISENDTVTMRRKFGTELRPLGVY